MARAAARGRRGDGDAEGVPAALSVDSDASRPKGALGAILAKSSRLEAMLLNRLERAGLPTPEHQFRFHPTRRWRADFAYPDPRHRLLIEVDGGTWTGGRHTRGAGFESDCEKTSTAAAMGWRVIRVTGRMIEDGLAVTLIAQALGLDTRPMRGADGSE